VFGLAGIPRHAPRKCRRSCMSPVVEPARRSVTLPGRRSLRSGLLHFPQTYTAVVVAREFLNNRTVLDIPRCKPSGRGSSTVGQGDALVVLSVLANASVDRIVGQLGGGGSCRGC
jgi:hypothetical protein